MEQRLQTQCSWLLWRIKLQIQVSIPFAFHFLSCLVFWVQLPGLCGIRVLIVGTLVPGPVIGEDIPSLPSIFMDASSGLFAGRFKLRNFLPVPYFLEEVFFFFKSWIDTEVFKCFFALIWSCELFSLACWYGGLHWLTFEYWTNLHPWHKPCSVMVYNSFYILLNPIC